MRGIRSLQQKLWRTTTTPVMLPYDVASGATNHGVPPMVLRTFSSSATPDVVIVNQYKAEHSSSLSDISKSTTILNNPEHAETTASVDGLLSFTRELMDDAAAGKNHHLRHVVAFSGGIDSSLVLALLEACNLDDNINNQREESVHAVIGISSAVPQDQLALARQVAQHIGTPLVEVPTTEGTDETYIANTGQACLACKTHLYSALEAVAQHAAAATATTQDNTTRGQYHHQLYNGTNADDVQDSTRVGLIAARNFQVQSPLIHTTKADVRRVAKHMGLPNWNVAASPCLRSRLALGVQATQDHLQRIEAAESFVRQQLNGLLKETSNLRVRLLAGNRAMLEVDADILPQVQEHLLVHQSTSIGANNNNNNNDYDWQNHFVQTLNFASIDARAFRSGSVSTTQPKEQLDEGQPSDRSSLEEKVAV